MLLRSMQVTEKIFGSRSKHKKEQFCVVAKAVKTFTQAHIALGLNNFKQFYKYGR